MKNLCFLFVALLFAVSLCSCQAEEKPLQKRLPPDRELTVEEALEYAVPLSGNALAEEIADDLELAKETYQGYYCLMNMVVHSVTEKEYLRGHFQPGWKYPNSVYFAAYVQEEEREGIVPGDIVQVVGKISAIEKHFNGAIIVEITDAHCLETSFSVSGVVQLVKHDSLERKYCIIVDDSVLPEWGQILIYLPESSDCTEGDTISASGKLNTSFVDGRQVLDMAAGGLSMYNPESIEIDPK